MDINNTLSDSDTNAKIILLSQQKRELENQRTEILNSTERVTLRTIEYHIPAKQGPAKIAKSVFKCDKWEALSIFNQVENRCIHDGWADLRLEPLKAGHYEVWGKPPSIGKAILPIIVEAEFPVEATYLICSGVTTETGSEKNMTGFQVNLIYELGKGCDVKIEVKALKKYNLECRRILEEISEDLKRIDNELNSLKSNNNCESHLILFLKP